MISGLSPVQSASASSSSLRQGWPGLIEAYHAYLPVSESTPIVTLMEGNTPLIPAPAIAQRIGRNVQVLIKFDGLNPTGSFKDRGMTMAVSKAKEAGATAVVCASTGSLPPPPMPVEAACVRLW